MGRLPSLIWPALALVLPAACEDKPVLATSSRAEAVSATAAAATAAPIPSARSPRPARKLCEGQLSKAARELPRRRPSRMSAPGELSGPGPLSPGSGRWLWINLWAAWCEPCKDELPLLRALTGRLARASQPVDLVFVSLDDDERQLEQFLRGQPPSGLRSTYWLHEGRERLDWLSEAGLSPDPQLPVSIWVDPRGRIRCVASGAIQGADYAEIAQMLGTP